MEFMIKSTVKIDKPTPDQLRAIQGRVRNLLMDFADETDINVIVDFAPTEVWFGSGVPEAEL